MFRRTVSLALSLAALTAAQTLPDLTITAFNTAGMTTDTQSLQVSGLVSVTVKNAGGSAVSTPFTVFLFEDRNQNSTYDAATDVALGQATVPGPLAANAETPVLVPVSGTVLFRGNIITGIVDNGRSITESSEANNTSRSSGQVALAPTGQLNPVVKWNKRTFSVLPNFDQVMVTPIVADLNKDGFPEIIFATFSGGDYYRGHLRAINGRDGSELWTVTNPSHRVHTQDTPAVGDIDGDGFPEILLLHEDLSLMAIEHDGSFKWKTTEKLGSRQFSNYSLGAASLADLNRDGTPEIIFGAVVFNSSGALLWRGAEGQGDSGQGQISTVVDLDLDGSPEVLAGRTAYRSNGSIYWNRTLPDGSTAVGNFDSDPNPEIVLVAAGNVYLLEHDGTTKWGPVALPGGGSGGPPVVADLDRDGQPEIGVAGSNAYTAFETNGSVKWSATIRDTSSYVTGSSVFDFEGDGKVEIVYGDELFLRIYNGEDGTELYKLAKGSGTASELPTIADVDGDGRAEIIAAANNYAFGAEKGIFVIGGSANNWANTRKIWNQFSYSITNVNDDGTIPRNPQNNWQVPGLNNFRLNTFSQPQSAGDAPDFTSSLIRKNDTTFPSSVRLSARVGNGGGSASGVRSAPAGQSQLAAINVCYNPAEYGLDSGYMALVDDKLKNPAYFGPNGTVRTTVNLIQISRPLSVASITAARCDVFQIGVTGSDAGLGDRFVDLTQAEVDALRAWSLLDRSKLVLGFQGFITKWGQYIARPGATNPMNATAAGEAVAFNGPFGKVLTGFNQGGSWQGVIVPGASDRYCALVEDSSSPRRPVAIVDQPTGDIFFSDVDILSHLGGVTFSPDLTSTNDIILANLWALIIRIVRDAPEDVCGYILSPTDVSFYRGDPNAGGTLIGRTRTTRALGPGEFEDVSVTWNNPPAGLHPIVAVADDPAAVAETDETNNKAGANVLLGIGPFPLVDGLLTRLKDTAVDLTWTPVPGAVTYNLYRRSTPTAAFQLVRSGLTAARYSDANLTNGATYQYLVRWVGATGLESADGTEASSTPAPDARAAGLTPPTILSNPVTRARTLARYSYQVTAGDPDAGDTLTYTVTAGPAGMNMNPSTGLIEWTPTAQQFGYVNVTVRVEDRTARFATQTYRLFVEAEIINNAPLITSTPITRGASGEPYGYRVTARDPDTGDLLTYALTAAPAGMTINQATGTISWIPTRVQVGTQTVTVRVTDLAGLSATQTFAVAVARGNKAPVFSSLPVTSARAGSGYRYQPVATDPDADPLTFSLVGVVPATTMTVDTATGLVSWAVPATGAAPLYDITIRVVDDGGLAATQAFRVSVGPPNQAPVFTSTALTSATSNTLYRYAATATDPNLPNDALFFSLRSAPTGMTINGNTGLIEWMPPAAAANTTPAISIEVKDIDGLTALQNFTLRVGPPDTTRPSVSFQTSLNGATLTTDTPILGTVNDDNLRAWRVEYRPVDSPEWLTLSSGTTAVNNGSLGTIPATLWANDVYRMRLYAEDAVGSVTSPEVEVVVDTKQLKMGDFTLSFEDLRVPGFTFPISILRKYDTKRPQSGDFGLGWTLGYSDVNVRLDVNKNAFVTLPDGRRVNFKYTPQCAAPSLIGCFLIYNTLYTPAPGVYDTLENLDCPQTISFGANALCGFDAFRAEVWKLTTKEGLKYTITRGVVTRMEDRVGNWLAFDQNGVTSSTGRNVTIQRDAQGRITSISEPQPGGQMRYEYDARGRLVRWFDLNGKVTNYAYENPGFPHYLTKITDPLGRDALRNVFGADGRLVAQCDANGDPATLIGCQQFNSQPGTNTFTAINGRGFKTVLITDNRGNVLTERRFTDATNYLETTRTYDANNNTLTERDPEGNVRTSTYDARGNRLTESDPGGRTTAYTYDLHCDKATAVRDPAGNTSRYTYDADCNLRIVQDPLLKATEYQYNSAGQRTKMIDPNGTTWTWTYSPSGLLQSILDPFGRATAFSFDQKGNLLSRTDRNGHRIDFQYDAANRPTRESWDNGRIFSYSYDDLGLLLSATDPDSRLTMTYDNVGRIQSVDNGGTIGVPRVTTTYSYDANGNTTRVQDSLGGLAEYHYDAVDRVSRVIQSGSTILPKRVDFTYNAAGLITQVRRFSDLAATLGVASTTFAYECAGCPDRLTAISHRKASDNTVLHDLTFMRDALGSVSRSTDAEGAHSYSLDSLRRLTSAVHSTSISQPNEFYTYDAVGNRLSSHLSHFYTYSWQSTGKGNRLLRDNQFDYSYDNEGNLIQKLDLASGRRTVFAYDYRNRLTAIENYMGATLTERSSYLYDVANRRIHSNEPGADRRFGYDSLNPTLTFNAAGQILGRRLYGRDLDAIIAEDVAQQTRWFILDQVGTVRDLISNNGTALAHYEYDSFGQLLTQASNTASNDLLFTGREYSPINRVGYFRARFYDPRLGRFLGEDPLVSYQSVDTEELSELSFRGIHANGYQYAANLPTLLTDPTGLVEAVDYSLTASQFIGRYCLGKILREFPAELLIYTVAEILAGIDGVDAKKLSKARKLLRDRRFRKVC